jgi:DNA-binding XRE family transcriptional regulator
MTDEPNKGGRPTKFEDAFCDRIIELMAQGYSLTAAASELNVSRETVYAWEKDGNHPAFSDAVKLARGKRTFKLETDLLKAPDGPTVTSRIFALKNACAEEWREKVETETYGKGGGPIQVNISSDDDRL